MSAQRNMANNGLNVWVQMNQPIPRGQCGYKEGFMSSRCQCKRFMLHPMNAATSFHCDGCTHHSSYHDLVNEVDDAVMRKWKDQERAQAEEMRQVVEPSRKRQRGQISLFKANEDQMRNQNYNDFLSGRAGKERKAPTPKTGSSNAPPNAATGPSAGPSSKAPASQAVVTRAKSKTLLSEEDDSRIEEVE